MNKSIMKNALILASGGLDSFVTAHYVKKILKRKIKLLFFDYGQKALKQEFYCVKKLAKQLNSELKIIKLNFLKEFSTDFIKDKNKRIKFYIPCRNSIFIITALSYAESLFITKKQKYDIFIGIKYEGDLQFKDTTPGFLKKINELTKECTEKGNYKIIAPFLNKEKEDLVLLAKKLKINLAVSYSCYTGKGFKNKVPVHCGECAACKARKKGFYFSNTKDPSLYSLQKF